jgi:hypothetical protein
VVDALDPSLQSIEDIGGHAVMLDIARRQWKKNEELVREQDRENYRQSLRRIGLQDEGKLA